MNARATVAADCGRCEGTGLIRVEGKGGRQACPECDGEGYRLFDVVTPAIRKALGRLLDYALNDETREIDGADVSLLMDVAEER